MSKTARLRENNYDGVRETDVKELKRSGALRQKTKMSPFSKKTRI